MQKQKLQTARKNLCSGCGMNYATMESFEKHRVGEFGKDRRCLTSAEMEAKGWEYSEPLVTFTVEGVSSQKATPTWACPVSEKRQETLRKGQETMKRQRQQIKAVVS
jgi:hypothetical protein